MSELLSITSKEFLARKDISVTDKLIYARIRSFLPNGCPMSQATLANELGVTPTTVSNSIRKLLRISLLTKGEYGFIQAA